MLIFYERKVCGDFCSSHWTLAFLIYGFGFIILAMYLLFVPPMEQIEKKEIQKSKQGLNKKDFAMISSLNKFIYLIYLISNENTFRNVVLICDFLEYTDTFFFDIYSVIGFFIRQYLNSNPKDLKMKEWVISRYSENPDSPFTQNEIMSWRHDTQ